MRNFFLAVILEPPENQYILENEVATLTCKMQGAKFALWFINGNDTDHHKSYYVELGVIFDKSNYSTFTNLTMTVPACLASKVNNIECVAKDRLRRADWSDEVRINVFKTFRKCMILFIVTANNPWYSIQHTERYSTSL